MNPSGPALGGLVWEWAARRGFAPCSIPQPWNTGMSPNRARRGWQERLSLCEAPLLAHAR